MGGGPEHSQPRKKRDEFTVLVTGMGPFPDGIGGRYPESANTSHLVTQLLPSHLPPTSPLNPTLLPIRILNPTAPPGAYVKSEYAYIRTYIQSLWDEHGENVDLILHLGMADGWEWYTVERVAFNERFTCAWWGPREESEGFYLFEDDEGKTVRGIAGEERGMWDRAPMGLRTGIDVDRAVKEAWGLANGGVGDEVSPSVNFDIPINKNANLQAITDTLESNEGKLKIAVVPHLEAGFYCCGFIFYESLATRWKRKMDTEVMFTHVPGWRDAERLGRGAEVICAIIGSACLQIGERDVVPELDLACNI